MIKKIVEGFRKARKSIAKFEGVIMTWHVLRIWPDYFQARVAEVSAVCSKRLLEEQMSARGMVHCRYCFSTKGPLRNHHGTVLCEEHRRALIGRVPDKIKGGKP